MLGPLGALFASTGEVPPLTLFDKTHSVEERLRLKQCEEWHLCRPRGITHLMGGTILHPGMLVVGSSIEYRESK